MAAIDQSQPISNGGQFKCNTVNSTTIKNTDITNKDSYDKFPTECYGRVKCDSNMINSLVSPKHNVDNLNCRPRHNSFKEQDVNGHKQQTNCELNGCSSANTQYFNSKDSNTRTNLSFDKEIDLNAYDSINTTKSDPLTKGLNCVENSSALAFSDESVRKLDKCDTKFNCEIDIENVVPNEGVKEKDYNHCSLKMNEYPNGFITRPNPLLESDGQTVVKYNEQIGDVVMVSPKKCLFDFQEKIHQVEDSGTKNNHLKNEIFCIDDNNETDRLLSSNSFRKNIGVYHANVDDKKRSSSLSDTMHARSNNHTINNSDSIHTLSSIKRGGIAKSDSVDTDRPVLHVQFHNGPDGSFGAFPSKDQCPSPSMSTSSSSTSSSDDNSSIGLAEARAPDGGWGWVIVVASFLVNLIADGITFSFGVIFVEFLNYFGEKKSKTAWIGSLFMAMPLLSGPIASFLTDRYGCRKVTIVGSVLASSGFVISSFINSIELLFLTFGVLAGFGLSLCYVAAVVIVAYYFDKKRSLATGLSVCGSGIGTFIFAPLTQILLDEYGWRGTTLILAGLFLNLAVCGALMRDLPWTTNQNKAKAEDRKRNRKKHRNQNCSSADSFSVSNSTNTASMVQPLTAELLQNPVAEEDCESNENSRLFSSLVNLPTFINNGEKVPLEVLELLSTHKNVYNVLLQNYPSLLISSRSFSDSGRLNELAPNPGSVTAKFVTVPSPLTIPMNFLHVSEKPLSDAEAAYLCWLKRTPAEEVIPAHHNFSSINRKMPTAYLKDLRVHRHSLTYRGAMLNINRYRLRASSCPDIYRNSMTTIAKEKLQWYAGVWDFWDLLVDILDFSYFTDIRFFLFAFSNFLLYAWYDVPYVYLTDYAIEMGFKDNASILISVIGIVNMGGEILLGWAGDKEWVNAGLVYAFCMGACGAVTALVPLFTSYSALLALSGAFGFFIAANYSLTSIILVELITLERFTNAYGLLLLVQGVANLVGPPIAGWIYDVTGTYDLSFYLAGIFIALSGFLLIILPATKRYKYFQTLQRQTSSSISVDSAHIKEPKFHIILASCITGEKNINKNSPVNSV